MHLETLTASEDEPGESLWLAERPTDEQLELLEDQVVESKLKLLGQNHADTVKSLHDLGALPCDQGRLDKAEDALNEGVDGARAVLDPNNEQRAAVLRNCTRSCIRLREAPGSLGPSPRGRRATSGGPRHGPDDGLTAVGDRAVGKYYLKMKEPAKAEAYFREEVSQRQKVTPHDWSRFTAEGHLGASLLGQKMFAEAEPFLLSAYRGMKVREQDIDADRKAELRWIIEQIIRFADEAGRFDDPAGFDAILADPDVQSIRRDFQFPAEPFAPPRAPFEDTRPPAGPQLSGPIR